MIFFAVLDTNVLVSALLNVRSLPALVLGEALAGCIVPLYDEEIMAEYIDVLHRSKFTFHKQYINSLLNGFKSRGVHVKASTSDIALPDLDDVVFYAVVMEKRKSEAAYLITGNQKHFPKVPFIVTPREMLEIIDSHERSDQ